MRRPGNILLLAVIIGALSAAMIYRYLRSQRGALQEAITVVEEVQKGVEATDTVVANQVIPIGKQIVAEDLKVVAWPKEAQLEGAVSDPKTLVGSVARTTIDENRPVTQALLVSEKAGLLPIMIKEGMRAMSVKVDRVSGVSGFITPNSSVDVVIAGTPVGSGHTGQIGKIVLQNVTVMATGMQIELQDNEPVEVPTVTLLVSPTDAEKLTLATRQGPLQLALRNFQDETVVVTGGATVGALYGQVKPPPGAKVKRVVPRRSGYRVEVLLGDRMTRQKVS